jgi:dethiobiotin synthetase
VRCFVTGTDTGVGKTYVTALLTRALRGAGLDTVALKPICCGPRDDVDALCAASEHELTPDETNPIWLEAPAAPLVAARRENTTIELAALDRWFEGIQAGRNSLLVEGVGGWAVPLAPGHTSADLAELLGLPVLVVVANKLGCLNHTLLTLESIRARGLRCEGLILNSLEADVSVAVETNRGILEEFCEVPVLFEVGPGQTSIALGIG